MLLLLVWHKDKEHTVLGTKGSDMISTTSLQNAKVPALQYIQEVSYTVLVFAPPTVLLRLWDWYCSAVRDTAGTTDRTAYLFT